MTTPNLTLYGIETQILELMSYRDEVALDPDITPADQAETLKAIDLQIAEYVKAEVQKVDGVAAMLREFEKRAETLKDEAKRINNRAIAWQRRHDSVEELVKGVLSLLPEGKRKIEGKTSTLALRKSPASVEVPQPELLPAEYQRVKVTMTVYLWNRVKDMLFNLRGNDSVVAVAMDLLDCKASEPEPMKPEIAAELKAKRGVPGARLVEDKCWLKVD